MAPRLTVEARLQLTYFPIAKALNVGRSVIVWAVFLMLSLDNFIMYAHKNIALHIKQKSHVDAVDQRTYRDTAKRP